MMGYFTYDNVWEIHSVIQVGFPAYVGKKETFGETYEKNPMDSFKIGKFMGKPLFFEKIRPNRHQKIQKHIIAKFATSCKGANESNNAYDCFYIKSESPIPKPGN